MLETKAEYARRHGVSKAAVQKWEKNGWLVFSGTAVDVEASDAQLARYRNSHDGRAKKSKPSASKPEPKVNRRVSEDETPAQAAERILTAIGADMSIEEAKRVKENYLALLNQLEYDQQAGLVVAVDEVARVVATEYAKVRTRLLAIPAEQAPRLHRLKTVAEVQDALQEIVTEALEELTRDGGNG